MKAVVVKAEKETLPQFNAATGQDEPTLVVVTHVHYYKDDGTLFHSQTYAQRPEEIDAENPQKYFDQQANVLQADLDGQAKNAESQATSELADQIVEKLMPTKDEASPAE
jgi:S-methylmethionine-dependent homocysteine/selenocysteine methylase